MKSMEQAQNITVGLQAAALHSTYIMSAITEVCNTKRPHKVQTSNFSLQPTHLCRI